jgi:hypothetical protein
MIRCHDVAPQLELFCFLPIDWTEAFLLSASCFLIGLAPEIGENGEVS